MSNQFTTTRDGLNIKVTANSPGLTQLGDITVNSASSNLAYYNGTAASDLATASNTLTLTNKSVDASVNTITNIVNSCIATGAAIAYAKLNLAGAILGSDISSSAAISYSKLNLAGSVVNSDISSTAAIAYSKLALTGNILNADISSAAAIAYSKLNLAGSILNSDISSSAAIAYSKLNLAGSVKLTTDVTGVLAITNGGTGVSSLPATPTASAFAAWDANSNLSANSFMSAVATVATAAGTTTLTAASKEVQIFTGTTTQTVIFPNATTMTVGQGFTLFNQSTGLVSLQFNGGAAFTDATGKNYALLSSLTSITVVLQTNGTSAGTWAVVASSSAGLNAPSPTVQRLTSGTSLTYTTPANVAFIQVEMIGGGGGGAGTGTGSSGAGGNGGTTSFGTSLLTATGGTGGSPLGADGGAGGSATVNSPAIKLIANAGASGQGSQVVLGVTSQFGGVPGASTTFGSNNGGTYTGAAVTPIPNIGAGGSTGSVTSGDSSGSSGAAGGYIKAIIANPNATYTYSVGTGGTGGTAGTSGFVGNAGSSGVIIVTEYYYNGLGASGGNGGAYTPTVDVLTTGTSLTYTVKPNAYFIQVEMVGGGGGGAGGGDAGSGSLSGGNGTATTFGTSLLSAGGGQGGPNVNSVGGTGGTASLGTGPIGIAQPGGQGQGSAFSLTTAGNPLAGNGGSNPFGGQGNSVYGGSGAGQTAVANTGGGGAGGGMNANTQGYHGAGGGAGGYVKAIITNPLSSYTYSVGTGGSAGSGGTNGFNGGSGAAGVIIITTYYMNGAVGTATNVTGVVAAANGGTGSNTFHGNYYWSGQYPTSTTNYWTSTNTSFGDWVVNGTIPTIAAYQSANITVTNAASNLPGFAIASAPRTGTLKITAVLSFDSNAAGTISFAHKLIESTTSTTIASGSGQSSLGAAVSQTSMFTLVGYFNTVVGTPYNFKLQTISSSSTSTYLGFANPDPGGLSFAMEYIN